MHPIKSEIWYPFKNVIINDGQKNIKVNKNTKIDIPQKTTHSLSKGSTIFEVQDNIPFYYTETYRIYDKSKRKTHKEEFNAFHFLNTNCIKLLNDDSVISKGKIEQDSFVFSKYKDFKIKSGNKELTINKQELWFLSKGSIILEDLKDTILTEARYINEV